MRKGARFFLLAGLTATLGGGACGGSNTSASDAGVRDAAVFDATNTDTTPPTATVSPATGSVIKTADAVTITFSEEMNPSTLTVSGSMAAAATTVWSAGTHDNDTLTITPSASWDAAVPGSLTLVVDDLAGNNLPQLDIDYAINLDVTNFMSADVVIGQGGLRKPHGE